MNKLKTLGYFFSLFLAFTSISHAQEAFGGHDARPGTDKRAFRLSLRATASVVTGTYYPISNSCGGTIEAFQTRLLVSQDGRKFAVKIPSGRVLRGTGGRNGFTVTGSYNDGEAWRDRIDAGAIKNRRANFRLTIQHVNSGCQGIWQGTMDVR